MSHGAMVYAMSQGSTFLYTKVEKDEIYWNCRESGNHLLELLEQHGGILNTEKWNFWDLTRGYPIELSASLALQLHVSKFRMKYIGLM